MKYISQALAQRIDLDLMSTGGYSLAQLMELAGLGVAQSIHSEYPPLTHNNVLLLCGPGNNGGDGLVAARHLKLFGYAPEIVYPKKPERFAVQT